ncbi:MAG TPA: ABC transporter substrate-binding protein [Burkholderiales bacterium]|nr:ABC transporter substrate-binding protein [Burkholderiales bacterium]
MKHVIGYSLLGAALALALAGPATAAEAKVSDGVVKIGVLTDLSGIYSDLAGEGSVLAANMAVKDFGGTVLGKPIQVIKGDTQNSKADIAANIARKWYDDDKVDMIVDLVATNVALAGMEVGKQKHKITLVVGAASLPITNQKCEPWSVHWIYDTYSLATGTGRALVDKGYKNWFFITANYQFGKSLQHDTTEVIDAAGGKVVGSVLAPFPSQDFSSFLLKAQASNAQVIGLANAGSDTINAVKQAAEFGIMGSKQIVAPLLLFISDVHSIGLKTAQGMYLTTGFYWDMDKQTRAWSKRFFDVRKRMPTMVQAGVYSATLNYLRAVKAAGTDDSDPVMKQLKSMTISDPIIHKGHIRADGTLIHDMYLVQVKKPSESKYPWDYYKVVATIPGKKAFLPADKSVCPLMKQPYNYGK